MDDLYYRKSESRSRILGILQPLFRNRKLVLTLLIGIPVVAYVLFGSRGVVQRVRLEQQKSEVQAKIKEAEADSKKLREESKALDEDRKKIEKVARENHQMTRPGEKVYRAAGEK